MFLGSSIMSFALPYGSFIVVAVALFVLFRAGHSGPQLKYLPAGRVTSIMTREPGPPAASAPAAEDVPAASAPAASEPAADEDGADPAGSTPEGTP
jgi:hypothetical protein